MASNTPRLGLYKKDPIADANDTFNIQTMLNDNWDKIDGKVAILGPDGKILSEQLPQQSLPNASITQAGIVQLNDTLTSTSTTQAATANAVKQVNDAVVAHSADYVKHPAYAVASGSANAYTVTLNPAPTAYVDGMAVSVKINVDSTGPSTLNVNGLGAKPLKKANGSDATNLKTNGVYTFRYNASTGNFILQGEGGSGNAQPSDVLSGKTFMNDIGEQVGTMPNRGAYNITPGTSNITIPAGYHNGSGVVYGDPDLISSNIRQGVDIFGVVGTLVEGRRWASGTISVPNNSYSFSISGLSFTPSLIIAHLSSNSQYVLGSLIVASKNNDIYQSNGYVQASFGYNYNGSINFTTASGITFYNGGASGIPVVNSAVTQYLKWYAFE